jgi:tRNA pseudouridine55 synthase
MEHIITRSYLPEDHDFLAGAMFLVDKPLEWTSFDVVNKLRYKLKHSIGVKKIKVGHSGTLDPLATGLLLICCGKYTKKLTELTVADKRYEGTMKLGATTASYDAELEEENIKPTDHITEELVEEVLPAYRGKIAQYPPIFSAIKKNGQALYKLARKGIEVRPDPREVEIFSLEVKNVELPYVKLDIHCGKGTYIRSLAHDIGQSLGVGAYLSQLRRTTIGPYNVSDALSIEEIVNYIEQSKKSDL